MNHHASPDFWACYHSLPTEVQQLADRAYELLKRDSRHPSLHLKKVGRYWSVRVGDHYRALAVEAPDGLNNAPCPASLPGEEGVPGLVSRELLRRYGL